MKRYGQLDRLKPEHYEEYVKAHAEAWPGVLATIADCNIRNYSIFHHDGLLFTYFEYVGDDFAADMARMAEDPVTQRWWALVRPMLQPLMAEGEGKGDGWYHDIEEVFHVD